MDIRWTVKDKIDSKIIDEFYKELKINKKLLELLVQRGINSYGAAKNFFRPSLEHLHDPFLMKDMDIAVERLEEAIANGEKILIYGDYDVDGTTSVALVHKFLHEFHPNIDFYIPDRYTEGYGISKKGIEYAHSSGVKLIISLDCGIKAVNRIRDAKNVGIDFIVCDHHTPGKELPVAVACLDPKRIDCPYPDKNLSGCGVGFKFMQAFVRKRNISEESLFQYLDLVAVSVASDIVPIIGENRILTYYGLKQLNEDPSTGLQSIIEISNLKDKEVFISDIVFKLGPRINAAGRIESGMNAVDLLISVDEDLALTIGEKIDGFNETRKELDRLTTKEAIEMIEESSEKQQQSSTILFNPNWHKGVIGIVASRLIDSYYRPTIILTQTGDLITGSARSVEGFDIYNAIESCSDLLENFGGHIYAAGLTMKSENLDEFVNRFEKYVNDHITEEQKQPQIEIDLEILLKDINDKFFDILKQFSPFGPENMRPIFVTRRVRDYGTSRLVGKDKNHIRLEVIEDESGAIIKGVGFNLEKHFSLIKSGEAFDICYTLDENTFNNKTTIQIMVKDIKKSEEFYF